MTMAIWIEVCKSICEVFNLIDTATFAVADGAICCYKTRYYTDFKSMCIW